MGAPENPAQNKVVVTPPHQSQIDPLPLHDPLKNGESNGKGTNGANHGEIILEASAPVQGPLVQKEEEDDDPFRYGWREFPVVDEKGHIEYERIPLSLEDLLHPQEEDFRVQSRHHIETCFKLFGIFERVLTHLPDSVVLSDVRTDWNFPDVKPFGPDIVVITEADIQPASKGTYVVGEDGLAPILCIEVTSPSTRSQDFYTKPELMQRVGLPYYFVADIIGPPEKRKVYGFKLTDDGFYIGIRPNKRGWVWMEPVGLWLGIRDGDVECYDSGGNRMLKQVELAKNLEVEAQRANEEAQRANEEAQRANEEAQRANEEAQRAHEEAQRANTLDEENQRLQSYLRSIGVDPSTIPKT